MALAQDEVSWRIASESVRGASHKRRRAPNQDSVRTVRLAGGAGVVLAIADGHGDVRHCRSDRGSRFAVDAAAAILSAWLASTASLSDQAIRRSVRDLPGRLVEGWHAKVSEDLRRDPPPERSNGNAERRDPPEILYGSTLIVAGISSRLAIFVQIGDGDILAVGKDDGVTRVARGRMDLPTHITESLCQPDAVDRFRTELVFFAGNDRPELVLLSTDGYANSFVDERAFMKVGCDLKRNLERDGIDRVAEQLEGWLGRTSKAGSGDDITLALLWSPGGAPEARDAHRRRHRPVLRSIAGLAALLILAAVVVRIWFPSAWSDVAVAEWLKAVSSVTHIGPWGDASPDPGKAPGARPDYSRAGRRD